MTHPNQAGWFDAIPPRRHKGRAMTNVIRIRFSSIMPWRCKHPPAVRRYAAMLRAGQKLPPIEVIDYGGVYEISDGMHRARAAKMVGRKTIEAIQIVEG
jgi:hypothetical protein